MLNNPATQTKVHFSKTAEIGVSARALGFQLRVAGLAAAGSGGQDGCWID